MRRGQYILSNNVKFALILQYDGNLVMYSGDKAIWASNTAGRGADYLAMQQDGNLVLYDKTGTKAIWGVGSPGARYLAMQDDGNLVIYGDNARPFWASNTARYPTHVYRGANVLTSNQALGVDQYLKSRDGRYALLMQNDGNLVLYGPGYHILWTSGTAGKGAAYVAMQRDGNLVLYRSNGVTAVWGSGTAGRGSSYLAMQNDGNLVIYTVAVVPTWSSRTAGKI